MHILTATSYRNLTAFLSQIVQLVQFFVSNFELFKLMSLGDHTQDTRVIKYLRT